MEDYEGDVMMIYSLRNERVVMSSPHPPVASVFSPSSDRNCMPIRPHHHHPHPLSKETQAVQLEERKIEHIFTPLLLTIKG